jgi:hypothetical protein
MKDLPELTSYRESRRGFTRIRRVRDYINFEFLYYALTDSKNKAAKAHALTYETSTPGRFFLQYALIFPKAARHSVSLHYYESIATEFWCCLVRLRI